MEENRGEEKESQSPLRGRWEGSRKLEVFKTFGTILTFFAWRGRKGGEVERPKRLKQFFISILCWQNSEKMFDPVSVLNIIKQHLNICVQICIRIIIGNFHSIPYTIASELNHQNNNASNNTNAFQRVKLPSSSGKRNRFGNVSSCFLHWRIATAKVNKSNWF